MKSSSPPRSKSSITTKEPNYEGPLDDSTILYKSWMLKYPCALSSFKKITKNAKGKRIALFLDYDGTLSPIVDDPKRAFMSVKGSKVNLFQPPTATEFIPMIDEVLRNQNRGCGSLVSSVPKESDA